MGVGTDDENNNRIIDERDLDADPIVWGETAQDGVSGKTTCQLKSPTSYTDLGSVTGDNADDCNNAAALYTTLNLDLDDADNDGDLATGATIRGTSAPRRTTRC